MNINNIEELLDRYFEGETSLEEEEQLRQYFRQNHVEKEFEIYTPIFNLLDKEREMLETVVPPKKSKKHTLIYLWAGVAASLLLVTIIRLGEQRTNSQSQSIVYVDGKQISDPNVINSQALLSIENIYSMDDDIINTQIAVLDSFTD